MRAGTPFFRARLLAAQIAAIRGYATSPLEAREAIAELGEYRSRGHGRGSPLGRGYGLFHGHDALGRPDGSVVAKLLPTSKYEPHQGRREKMRRMLGGFAGIVAPQMGVNT